jgi:flagellar biosynthetic protein FliR
MDSTVAEAEIFKLFLLVLARVSGLMVSAPVIGSTSYPIMAKVGFSGAIALLITPVLPPLGWALPADGLELALIAIGELAIGILLGFVITLVFAAVQVGGQIMDLQTGFGMMNIFNPTFESQFPVFGFFLFILAVLYMLVLGWHHMMIKALVATYTDVPLGAVVFKPEMFLEASRWGHAMFVDGLMIAAPVAAAMIMAYATLGLLGRVVPQIQLFSVGFPITIAIGLFLTAFIIGVYLNFLDGAFYRTFHGAQSLIRSLS